MDKKAIAKAWSGATACENCSVRHLALFADLVQEDFELIHKPIIELTKDAGQLLYNSEDDAQYLYTVRSGIVKLLQYLPDGTQRIVRLLRTGDVVGLEALINKNYDHDAVVLREAHLCQVPKSVVELLNRETPRLHSQLLQRWHGAVQKADAWLTELSTGSSKARVARLILGLCHEETRQCTLFSREDMGAILGVATETTSRIVAEFKRAGLLLDLGGNHFEVDLAGLRDIADGGS